MDDLQMIDIRQLGEIIGCSRSTIHRNVKAGKLPEPVKICGMVRWRLADIQALVGATEVQKPASRMRTGVRAAG